MVQIKTRFNCEYGVKLGCPQNCDYLLSLRLKLTVISLETYRICDGISTDLYVTHLYRSSSRHDDLDYLARNGYRTG